jgi:hypothetical protein
LFLIAFVAEVSRIWSETVPTPQQFYYYYCSPPIINGDGYGAEDGGHASARKWNEVRAPSISEEDPVVVES